MNTDPSPSSQIPHWKQDFPVKWGDDTYITRREFTKFLGLTSVGFLLGTCLAAVRRWTKQSQLRQQDEFLVGKLEDIPVGGYKLFRYPTENDPCILVRLTREKLVAYNQHCTHLACPVYFRPETAQMVCPCHEGFFSAEDGRVLAGPPKRPLVRLAVEVKSGRVWVKPWEDRANES